MATSGIAPVSVSVSGGNHLKACQLWSPKPSSFFGTPTTLTIQSNSYRRPTLRKLMTVHAQYNDHRGGGGGDFVAGFLVGGAIFGTLAYVFAPQTVFSSTSMRLFLGWSRKNADMILVGTVL